VKLSFIHILLIILILSGCTGKKLPVATLVLKPSDYTETIETSGTIQAVNSTPFVVPRIFVSNLKVGYLKKEGTYIKKGDTVCIIAAPDLIRNYDNYNDDLKKMEAELRSLEADNAMQLSLLMAQVETNNAQMEISSLDSIQQRFAPPVKKRLMALEMEKVNIEKNKLQKKLASQKKIDNSELVQIQSRIAMQKNLLQMTQSQITSLTMLAPIDGMVMHVVSPEIMFFSSNGPGTLGGKIEEGSLVFGGMSVASIPDLKLMQVSGEVQEADYKRIEENQKVEIQVDAASKLLTTGKIIRKTLSGKKSSEESNVKTYEVVISVDSCHLKMKPGLSANCHIIIGQVKDTIVIPTSAVFTVDSSKVVYVARGKQFIPVIIETGLSNSSRTIVTKGLSGNETIALVEPSYNLIKKMPKSASHFRPDSTKKDSLTKKDSIIKQ
jgi:multidrug efflux pump subunit AcrA (membrane-fusion protein)